MGTCAPLTCASPPLLYPEIHVADVDEGMCMEPCLETWIHCGAPHGGEGIPSMAEEGRIASEDGGSDATRVPREQIQATVSGRGPQHKTAQHGPEHHSRGTNRQVCLGSSECVYAHTWVCMCAHVCNSLEEML